MEASSLGKVCWLCFVTVLTIDLEPSVWVIYYLGDNCFFSQDR